MIKFAIKVPRKLKKRVKKSCLFYGNIGTIQRVHKNGYLISGAPCLAKTDKRYN